MCVTIIIPTKDNTESLNTTLRNIISVTTSKFVIYLMDASKEAHWEWERDYPDKIKVFSINSKTSIIAMNEGMKKAEGDVLLTHDDVLFPPFYKGDWIARLKEAGKEGMSTCLNGGGISRKEYLNNLRWVGTWCTYIPKETLKKVGYLDTDMKTGEDIDYTYRVMKEGLKIAICPFTVDHHRSNEKPQDKAMAEGLADKMGEYFKKKHGLK